MAVSTALGSVTYAQDHRTLQVDISGQSLAQALTETAKRSGVDLLLAAPTVQGLRAPRLKGRFTFDQTLAKLLEGSGLTYRRTSDGGYVVSLAPAPGVVVEEVPVTLPELLVIGKRTQNSDIRRTENDIQPYKVWNSRDVENAHSTDVADFLRTRLTSNARAGSAPDNRAQVDLRGLGSGQTLVLVDGRRMPGLPLRDNSSVTILQADLNGVPLNAIERIEVLNSTAGGIYGAGATAGAVNIVLKRDYHGADFAVTYGQSARGDAAAERIDGRVGFSTAEDRTQVMATFSQSWGADLRVGDRDFSDRARAVRQARGPAALVTETPIGAAINVFSQDGSLSLDPALGGTRLGAETTFAPIAYQGVASDGGALLVANAGRTDVTLAPDGSGTQESLLTRPRARALIVNGRQRFGSSVEAYVDLMVLRTDGRVVAGQSAQSVTLSADAPTNPFQQDITVTYPLPGYDNLLRIDTHTTRLTGGLIVDLPWRWKANADFSLGRVSDRYRASGLTLSPDYVFAAYYGLSGTRFGPPVDPLAGQAALLTAITPYTLRLDDDATRINRFSDATLRLAGPVMTLPGGPLTLSLLAELRTEKIPTSNAQDTLALYDPSINTTMPAGGTRTRSWYAEMRAPLTDRDAGPAHLKGLELQLALRRDNNQATLPANLFTFAPTQSLPSRTQAAATVYTAGLRFFPFDGVMVRASAASGFQPPGIDQIGSQVYSLAANSSLFPTVTTPYAYILRSGPRDTRRGGARLGSENAFQVISAGSARLRPERAQSVSVGMVLTPPAIERLRISVDYTRIDKTREIVSFHSDDFTYFLAHEDQFPGRVARATLTDADRAKGYTAGVVTSVDTTSANLGRSLVEAVDIQADYLIPNARLGDLQLSLATTWQPHLTRHVDPDAAPIDYVNYTRGPLAWRANGGVDWSRGSVSLGLNAAYYGAYSVALADDTAADAALKTTLQGRNKIPAQVYFDLYGVRRIDLPPGRGVRSIDVRFGLQNLLDHRPPLVVSNLGLNYSPYGDPRLRRFELNLVAHF